MWAKQEVLQSDQRLGQERNEESREPIAEAEENVGVGSTAGLDLGGSINIREAAKMREWEQTWTLAVTPLQKNLILVGVGHEPDSCGHTTGGDSSLNG